VKTPKIMAATLVSLACVVSLAGHSFAGQSFAAGSERLTMQIKTSGGTVLASDVQPAPADYAGALFITCYVDDVTPPFRIVNNVAYRSVIGCDAPVSSASYGEALVRRNGPEEYVIEGTLPGPLTTWTPFNPVVGPCIEDWWIPAFAVTVFFTPSNSLTRFFGPPEAYITCL
jgi:hypothetical protein